MFFNRRSGMSSSKNAPVIPKTFGNRNEAAPNPRYMNKSASHAPVFPSQFPTISSRSENRESAD